MSIPPGLIRGACADCGYRAWLDKDGLVGDHVVRRVHRDPKDGKVRSYPGTEDGDEHCTGAGRPPQDVPSRPLERRRVAA